MGVRICHREAKRAPSAIVETSLAALRARRSAANTRISRDRHGSGRLACRNPTTREAAQLLLDRAALPDRWSGRSTPPRTRRPRSCGCTRSTTASGSPAPPPRPSTPSWDLTAWLGLGTVSVPRTEPRAEVDSPPRAASLRYSSPSQYPRVGPGRASMIGSPAASRAKTFPVSRYSMRSGPIIDDSMSTRIGESVPLII